MEKVNKALDIISLSISNKVFGGAKLLVAASRAKGHGTLVSETLFYGKFNPSDFSLPGSFTKEKREEAKKEYGYKSQLEPSESGQIPQSPRGESLESNPNTSNVHPSYPSQNPLQPPSPISLPLPPPAPPKKTFVRKPIMK